MTTAAAIGSTRGDARANPDITLTPALRLRIEATIEHLLAVLDEADGDCDIEPDADAEDDEREFDEGERGIADRDAYEEFLLESDFSNHFAKYGEGYHWMQKMARQHRNRVLRRRQRGARP